MPKSNQSNLGTQLALSNQRQSWAGYALDIVGFATLFKHIVTPPKFDVDHFYSQAFMQIKQLCELVSFGRAGLQVLLTLARARLAVPISSFRSFG